MVTLLWILMAYGFTSILVWGKIFDNQRDWIKKHSNFFGDLFSCTLCTATWVGFFMSFVLGGLTIQYFSCPKIVGVFFDGMLTAGAIWGVNSIIEFFEENRIK